MRSFLNWLFYTGGFMSHGHCYLWEPSLVGLHVVSDLSIGIAYAVISLTLVYLVRRAHREIPFHWMFLAFGAFIICCGWTHLMEVWTIWMPVYWLSGGIKALTAAASVTTAVVLPRLVPETLVLIRNARLADERRIELERTNVALRKEVGERERADAALRKLNEELEERVRSRTAQLADVNDQLAENAAIVSHSTDAIYSQTLHGIITSWNPAAEGLYGYSAAEIVGRGATLLLPDGRGPELADAMERIGRGESVESFETIRLRKGGAPIDVHLSISPVRDVTGRIRGASVIGRDITDRKRAAQQLRETQKLESLGLIAGGVAHDFNNLLVGIMGNSSLALHSLSPFDPNHDLLEQVVAAGEKASHLTRQMLAYAGRSRFLVERIDLSALVSEIANLVRGSIPKPVELQLDLDENIPFIQGDSGQLQQVVMNLLINGAEAIGENRGGTVTVVTASRQLDEAEIYNKFPGESIKPGTYVSLEVRDTGCGMDADTRSKIFDPFFTTKFTGRGLGLAAALGIVRGHHGVIRVESTPGVGSTFRILIPSGGEGTSTTAAEPPQQELTGAGTVLVIDDEEVVRATSRATLEHFGYTVLTAENGQTGVDLFRPRAGEIAVVLLDLTMPVMSGEEAFRQIRAIHPGARVIISSGYDEAEAIRGFAADGIAAFVQKPYTAITLAKAVKSALS